ncbi:MAG: thioredoxin-like domain-containing protein [Bacteroidota bacterium]
MKMLHQSYQQIKAPELFGDRWYNSEPLSIRAALGQNILLFFWNYTSQASMRMLPTIKEWYAAYADMGLICIGVHAPEFSFAKKFQKVESAILRQEIQFPVVVDNDCLISDAYRITEFPALVLIAANGNVYDVVTQLFSFTRLERSIQYLLRQSGFFGELPMLQSIDTEQVLSRHASELTTGYMHGSLGNAEGYSPELASEYQDPHFYVEGKFYAHGVWKAERNAFQYAGEPNEGYLICQSDGDSVDALIGSELKSSVCVTVNDMTLLLEQMGADVKRDAKGNSIVAVNEPQFASVFRGREKQQHTVKFIPSAPGVTFYKLSFFKERADAGEAHLIRNN